MGLVDYNRSRWPERGEGIGLGFLYDGMTGLFRTEHSLGEGISISGGASGAEDVLLVLYTEM